VGYPQWLISPALRAATAIGRALRLRARQVGEVGAQIIQSLTGFPPGAKALEGIGQADHCLWRTGALAVAAIGLIIGERRILEIALAHQRVTQQEGRILGAGTGASADRLPRGSLGRSEIAAAKRGLTIRNGLFSGSRGAGGCRGWCLRRRPRLRRARGGRPASPSLERLQAEIQIAAQFFHLGAHLPVIIVGDINATAQAAVFFFKLLHTTKQLLHQIARGSRRA